jgi:uncharacterized membrane protein YcaP (DUF421 family)
VLAERAHKPGRSGVGQRALAKMSGYDLIVTVTLGSLVAAIPITSGLVFVDGLAALVTFFALQELTSSSAPV